MEKLIHKPRVGYTQKLRLLVSSTSDGVKLNWVVHYINFSHIICMKCAASTHVMYILRGQADMMVYYLPHPLIFGRRVGVINQCNAPICKLYMYYYNMNSIIIVVK